MSTDLVDGAIEEFAVGGKVWCPTMVEITQMQNAIVDATGSRPHLFCPGAKQSVYETANVEEMKHAIGLAVGAAYTGRLLEWCEQRARGLDDPGASFALMFAMLQQVVADLISLVVFAGDPDAQSEILSRFNRRVWKGLRREDVDEGAPDDRDAIEQRYKEAGVEEPSKLIASVPPGGLYELWLWLTGRWEEQTQ